MSSTSQPPSRTITAPAPSFAGATLPPNRVLSVELKPDEEVEWTTTSTADGTTYVSGYTILKSENRGAG
jgi:hypothetical protein